MSQLLYGIITGIFFGFFLQRGKVLRYDQQIGALRFMDMTIVKFMLTAIFIGTVGIYLLYDLGFAKLSIKSTILGATIVGGLLFGIGWGLLGYCPGTSIGAIGEGRTRAVPKKNLITGVVAPKVNDYVIALPWTDGELADSGHRSLE